jgi:6-phosphogluconolactonase
MCEKMIFAVGSYGASDSHNLRVFSVDGKGAEIEQTAAVSAGTNPSFVCSSQDGRFLYVVNEKNRKQHGSFGTIRTFHLDAENYSLSPVSEIGTAGDDPCFVTESPSGEFLIAVNYSSGTVVVFMKDRGGIPEELVHKVRLVGFGPDKQRQNSAHPHWAVFSPDGKYLYIPDLGSDRIWIFTMGRGGKLRTGVIPAVIMPSGSGPRVLTFDTGRNIAFCLNELSSTIVQFRYDPETGLLHRQKEVSTLPPEYRGPNTAAELYVRRNTVIASNRGHDSLAVIEYEESGFSRKGVWISSGGETPRSFCVGPKDEEYGSIVAAANQSSDSVVLFTFKQQEMHKIRELKIPAPSCVRVVNRSV